jgi:catechol-2,3-dioxygenase
MTPNQDLDAGTLFPMAPETRIGHVHLKVADLQRALDFYCGVLGFELTQRYGSQAAFVSAGGYDHHIGLNTWESAGGSPPPRGTTGLYHLAILYPTCAALANALRRLIAVGIRLRGCQRPRRERSPVFTRSRWERRGIVLGSPAASMAAGARRRLSDVHAAARR